MMLSFGPNAVLEFDFVAVGTDVVVDVGTLVDAGGVTTAAGDLGAAEADGAC
jgi:hypothetical protein